MFSHKKSIRPIHSIYPISMTFNALNISLCQRKNMPSYSSVMAFAHSSIALQICYFKAKQAFLRFSLQGISQKDITCVMQRYFPGRTVAQQPLQMTEYYL